MKLEKRYCSRLDAARIIGVSIKTIDRMIKNGQIKARKLNAAKGG